ncbi:MAG TPA: dephospho-CoA kinase [Gaiellales bacterium]|nr:dephospho-CoA kinase [Gaiellales bacterium]
MALVVGLTGGIGAGKSEALAAFARRGAATLSSDAVVRELYDRPSVREAVRRLFGDGVMTVAGAVDRVALARVVFADAVQRERLEQLLLPLLYEQFVAWRARAEAAGVPLLVHEAPTLFEAGVGDRYDLIVTVTAPADLREQRRPGAAERMRHQLPEEQKAARSDHVYVNAGSLDDLDRWVGGLVARLTGG